jgi:hypothetical protein
MQENGEIGPTPQGAAARRRSIVTKEYALKHNPPASEPRIGEARRRTGN